MRTLSVTNQAVTFSNSFRADTDKETKPSTGVVKPGRQDARPVKTGPLVTSTLALAAIIASGVAISRSNSARNSAKSELDARSKEIADKAKEEAMAVIKTLEEKLGKLTESEDKSALQKELDSLKSTLEDKTRWYDGYNTGTTERLNQLTTQINSIVASKGIAERGMIEIDGLTLMQNMMTDDAVPVSKKMQNYLKTISGKFQRGEVPLKELKKGDTVWSISTETKWRGTGGQGEIFTQQAKNFKEVGVTEYEILAANGIGGSTPCTLHCIDGNYTCHYGKEKFKVTKLMEFPMDTYHNNKHSVEMVTVYTGEDPMSKQPMLIFDNNRYFNSNHFIYGNSAGGITERERAAFLGEASSKFEKFLRDRRYLPKYEIFSSHYLDKIKVPDAVYLHDAAAAPYIMSARLKAPLEAANKELSPEAAKAMSENNIVAKFHNFDYRGESYNKIEESDILNTMLDKYAADIYRYAETGFAQEGMHDIGKVCVAGNGYATNFDNWLLSLVHNGENVSKTDLEERIAGRLNQGARSGAIQHMMEVRYNNGTIHGHGNSWDRVVNEVSPQQVAEKYNPMCNQDLFAILQAEIKNIKPLLSDAEKDKLKSTNLNFDSVDINNFTDIITSLKELNNTKVNEKLGKLEADGLTKLRSFTAYTKNDSTEHILSARKKNKWLFIEHLRTVQKYNKEHPDAPILDFIIPDNIDLNGITMDNLDDVVILSQGVRLVEQKNIPMWLKAAELVSKDFEKRYPGKKLIMMIGGPDDTAAKDFHKMITDGTKKTKGVIAKTGRTPNPLWNACSEYTMRTSVFEPDGDSAESLYKGTGLILTRVGGYVDRVDGTGKGFLAKRTPAEVAEAKEDLLEGMAKDYRDAIFDALDTYFNKPKEYQDMVRKCIDSEYSWIVYDENMKVTRDCGLARDLKMLGFNLDTFPEFARK